MKFIDYLKEVNAQEREFDACVGDVDMPATYCGDPDICLDNPYLHEKYGVLLNAEVEIIKPRKGETEVCVIDDVSDELGESFFMAAAGYCSCEEYSKLFDTAEKSGGEENPYLREYGGEHYFCIDITERFVSRYGEFFKDLQKVELSFYTYGNTSKEEVEYFAKQKADVIQKCKKISFDGENLFLTFESGKVLNFYASEWGSIYTFE